MAAKKLYLATFGCRTNQADSAAIRQSFLADGFEETDRCDHADVIVVNSCTVTHRSDQQVRQLSRKLRRENPTARLIIAGCYAQREPETLARIAGIDAVVGTTRHNEILEIAKSLQAPVPANVYEVAAIYRDDFSKMRSITESPAIQLGGRTRPFIKIQDGCDAACAYCIIPSVRGPSRSVPPEAIIRQVRALAESGYKEIVLTGIHMGTYGLHLQPRHALDKLLADILEIQSLAQIRLSSLEPMELSRHVIELAAASDRLAPHFHVCLQSGSDRILKAMLRPYKTAKFASIVEEIRKRLPDAGIGTDLIVGFPGETEQDHRDTVNFVRRMPFTYLHVFPYSDRPGTRAFAMREHVDASIKKRRGEELRALSEEKNREFRKRFLGVRMRALALTDEEEGKRIGLTGNYLRVRFPREFHANSFVEGLITGEAGHDLLMSDTLLE